MKLVSIEMMLKINRNVNCDAGLPKSGSIKANHLLRAVSLKFCLSTPLEVLESDFLRILNIFITE